MTSFRWELAKDFRSAAWGLRVKVKGRKVTTPGWVDKLLNFRKEISEDEYKKLWKRINKYKRGSAEWQAEGQRIIAELEAAKAPTLFRSGDYRNVGEAKRAAEVFQSDHGGRVVRRDSRGRFSSKGRTFQVIGGKK